MSNYLLVAIGVHLIGAIVGDPVHRTAVGESADLVRVVAVEYRRDEGEGELAIRKIFSSLEVELLDGAVVNLFQILLDVAREIEEARSGEEVLGGRERLHRGAKIFRLFLRPEAADVLVERGQDPRQGEILAGDVVLEGATAIALVVVHRDDVILNLTDGRRRRSLGRIKMSLQYNI